MTPTPERTPYTPLELAGRDIYIAEGCYNCHSQLVRPLVEDVLRYGPKSEASEFIYDHPFQWGSRRIGPDLARVGGKFPDLWHYRHMLDPRSTSPGSPMPAYPWLANSKTPFDTLPRKMAVMAHFGIPYSPDEVKNADVLALQQATEIASQLVPPEQVEKLSKTQVIALIAYLQKLQL